MGKSVKLRLRHLSQMLAIVSAGLLAFGFGNVSIGLAFTFFISNSNYRDANLGYAALLAAVLSGLAGYAAKSYGDGKPHCERWMRLCGLSHLLVGLAWTALFVPNLTSPPNPYLPFSTTTGGIVWLAPGLVVAVLGIICLLATTRTTNRPSSVLTPND
jgi:hypothetical protein